MSTFDLLGDEIDTPRRKNDRPEAAALVEVLRVLRNHPAVAFVERQNSGAVKVGNRFIRYGWKGAPDILGMMRDGRLLACEVKSPRGRLRPEQKEFLDLVQRFGGVAFVARNCRDVLKALL